MSGMVGLVDLGLAPVDMLLLERMTTAVEFRGPDARGTWSEGPAGLGHTLLRTTHEAAEERQPLSLDGRAWITADARIDAREDLAAELRDRGRPARLDRPDVELIAHAWAVWGPECVEHLLGDFAFAAWEPDARRLTLARDHLGVKPLYYAPIGRCVAFSNTLQAMRLHPEIPDTLDEAAIADFLLFGCNQEEGTTSYAAIGQVPRGCTVTWTPAGRTLRRYWSLPVEAPVYRRRAADYIEEFQALLAKAVGDRLRLPTVGVLMSGGLDSTTLAAEARRLLGRRTEPSPVRAFTTVVGPDDEERRYAALAAEYLGMGISVHDSRAEPDSPIVAGPEPQTSGAGGADRFAEAAAFSRVLFFGEGPDNALMYDWRGHIGELVRRRRYVRAALDLMLDRLSQPRLPGLTALRHAARGESLPAVLQQHYPSCLNPEIEARLRLRERWRQAFDAPPPHDPARPPAHRSFDLALWRLMFESFDPGVTGAALEVRHPFLDLRLLGFMLTVPTLPWRRRKLLIRRSMRGRLPDEILNRDKTPLAPRLTDPPRVPEPGADLAPQARAFFEPGVVKPGDIADAAAGARAERLNVWLRTRKHATR